MPTLRSNKAGNSAGFTIIEVMIALVILMVGMMGLISATGTALELNYQNQLRDEAMQVADDRLRLAKANGAASFSNPFTNLSTPVVRNSKLRSKNIVFTINLASTAAGDSSNVLRSVVTWDYKGRTNSQEITSLKQYH